MTASEILQFIGEKARRTESGLANILGTFVAASFDKQRHLADLVGERDWHFDMVTGRLSFGSHFYWRSQILGSESESSGTWRWAWANDLSNIPEDLLQASLTMRAFAEQYEIRELTVPELPLDEINGHRLSLLASGICEGNAYYRGPYEGGAAFFLIRDDSFPQNSESPLARITSLFPQAISALEIPNHRLALIAYLASYRILGRSEGNALFVEENGKKALTASFDDQNRLVMLETAFGKKEAHECRIDPLD